MSKKSSFRGCFDKQHGKRPQALLKSASQHLYHIPWELSSQFSWKKSLLLTCKILGLLVNTLVPDEKYPVSNRDNLTIRIQMPLSQREKPFSKFFAAFLKCPWKFEHFEKKDDSHRFCFNEVTDFENVDTHISKKSRFRGAFTKQYGKHGRALLKSSSQSLYHIHWSRTRKLSWKKSLLFFYFYFFSIKQLHGWQTYNRQ